LTVAVIIIAIIVAITAVINLDATGKKGNRLSEEFDYNIEDLGKVDPALILYSEILPPIDTSLNETSAIAIDDTGNIYIAGDTSISIFDQNKNRIKNINLTQRPNCLAVSGNRIYVGVIDHIEIYSTDGENIETWECLGEPAVLTSIAVDKNEIFVADAGNRLVVRYDKNGNIINRIGKKDPDRNIPGFVIPSPYFDLAVAKDGLLRVVNPGKHRIEAYTPDGDLEFSWGFPSSNIEGFCGCCNPINFAILPDGSFVTCEKGLTRVKVYDPDGAFTGVVAGPQQLVRGRSVSPCNTPSQCQSGGFDIAVDSKGRVYVLDTIKNSIRIFAKK
jgi:sugar lactone lactonase YvrE